MKPDLLLLHGALGSKAQFKALNPLLESHFQLHSFDFSGHGDAPLGPTFTIAQFAEDVLSYMNDQQLEKAMIFGYSMGGYVGLYLMAHHPQRIEKLVTLGTKLDWNPEGAAQEVRMLNADKILEKVPAFAEQLKRYHPAHDWREVLARTADLMLGLGQEPAVEAATLAHCTTMVVMGLGSKDHMVTEAETLSFVNQLPNVRFERLEHVPHPIEMVDGAHLAGFIQQSLQST